MPRVFVYEHVTAVGLGRDPGSPEHSLFVEGSAMRAAVTADFAAVPGVDLLNFPDDLPESDVVPTFRELASRADWSFVLAPETGGELERLTREVLAARGLPLGSSPNAVALTADKLWLAEHWERAEVPTPWTWDASSPLPRRKEVGGEWLNPLVLKPRDGAGSESTILVRTPVEYAAVLRQSAGPMIAQAHVEGRPASVAFLVGLSGITPLLPTYQLLSADGRFKYEGGELPVEPHHAEQAIELGRQAVACVPGLCGYVGVDLVLGERPVAIEINPRLTTSYVGLRAVAVRNLAGLMLEACSGRPAVPEWRPGRVRWTSSGVVSVS
ncbi:MAG: ATP-grasp domain-containing protein [Gemmataceae bacterium]